MGAKGKLCCGGNGRFGNMLCNSNLMGVYNVACVAYVETVGGGLRGRLRGLECAESRRKPEQRAVADGAGGPEAAADPAAERAERADGAGSGRGGGGGRRPAQRWY